MSSLEPSTTARKALLSTISEREKELSRIRDAAEKIIEEEQRSSEKQLERLHSQLAEQQHLLSNKDEMIQKLCGQMDRLQFDVQEHERILGERSKEEVERQVEKIQSRLQREYAAASEDQENHQRKKLQKEFEDKLASCEKKFHSEYQASLLIELKKQEESLWFNFESIAMQKQARQESREKELREIIRQKEREITEITKQYESQFEYSKSKLIGDIHNQKDRYEKMNHDLHEKNDELNNEKNKVNEQYQCAVDKLAKVEKEATYAKDQVQQLLDVLHSAEVNFVKKVEQFQFAESTKDDEISSLLNQLDRMTNLLKETKVNHRQDLKQLKKVHAAEKKSLQGKAHRLKNELQSIHNFKTKQIESTRTMNDHKNSEIAKLQNEVEKLKLESKNREEKVIRLEKESYQLQKELERKCEEAVSSKMKLQELKASFKLERSTLQEKLQDVVKERNTSNHSMQKEIMDLKIENHASRTSAEVETASLKELTIENRKLQSALDKVNSEKEDLKETVKEMRNELEKLISLTTQTSSGEKDVLAGLSSVHDQLKASILDFDENTLVKIRKVFSQIGEIIR